MARIAFVCPPFYSHVRAFEALGERLEILGHEPVFMLPEGSEAMLKRPFRNIAVVSEEPVSRMKALLRRVPQSSGILGILTTVAERARATDAFCKAAPEVLVREGFEAVIGDEFEPAAGLVARHLGLPHVSLAAALPIERDVAMPLPFLDWTYDPSEAGLARNRGGEMVGGFFLRSQRKVIRRCAERFGLPAPADDIACLSPSLRLSQTVPSFDFPRPATNLLSPVGPIRSERVETHPGPQDLAIDPARPFVFASLGTMQGHRFALFRKIVQACHDLGAQVLVAHCGGLDRKKSADLKAQWVVDFVDQKAFLQRADVCVTHAGLNTVLDCLASETPILALPIGYDQPGIGARIAYHQIGETIAAKRANADNIRSALSRLIVGRADYAGRMTRISKEIASAGGAERAATLVHEFLSRSERDVRIGRFAAVREAANDTGSGFSELSASV